MLIYLFLIFTFGWCICWLLFSSYQQQTRDSLDERERELLNQEQRLGCNQKHSFISKRQQTKEQQQQRDCEQEAEEEIVFNKSYCLRQLRRRLFQLRRGEKCLLDGLNEFDQSPEAGGCQPETSCTFNETREPIKLETIVNKDGYHSIVSSNCDYLNGECFQDDEDCLPSLLPMSSIDYFDEQVVAGAHQERQDDSCLSLFSLGGGGGDSNSGLDLSNNNNKCQALCETCARNSLMIMSSGMTGCKRSFEHLFEAQTAQVDASSDHHDNRKWWPTCSGGQLTVNMAALEESPELYANSIGELEEDEEDEDQLSYSWPMVELHENPFNCASDELFNSVNPIGVIQLEATEAARSPDDDDDQQRRQQSLAEELLDRSRLLSLQASQVEKRAAIRMVSTSSSVSKLLLLLLLLLSVS